MDSATYAPNDKPGAPKQGWEVFETGIPTGVTTLSDERNPAEGGVIGKDKQKTQKYDEQPKNVILSAIFSIEKTSYDVQMFEDKIAWTPVSPDFKKSSKLDHIVDRPLVDCGQVYIHQISAVRLKNIRNVKAKKITTVGFAIFTAGSKGEKLREQTTLFLCYSREICVSWASKIKAAIIARTDRPTRLLAVSPEVYLSTSAWCSIVEPRMQTVGIKVTLKEFGKGDSVTDFIKNTLSEQSISPDNETFQGILVIGKLTFFSEVVGAMIEFKKEMLKSGTWHPSFPTLGYIPSSTTNFVGKELHRISDAETAVLHAIYGCIQSVPICEFYDKDGNFLRYGLTASYGFSGGDTANDTSATGLRFIQGSVKKGLALTKAIVQRRSYPCEILYKDAALKFEPDDDEELFAEKEFAKFSIINKHYVDDEKEEKSEDERSPSPRSDKQASSDSDSGVWPKQDVWNTVQRKNYLDVMVTSLPQHGDEDDCLQPPLSALLVRETMSRKDLFVNMGSQVSLSSNMSKSKPEVLNKTDIVKGTEIIVKACSDPSVTNVNALSKWCIDDVCLPASIQEMHVKVAEFPILMYSRGPHQPLTTGSGVKILRINTDGPDMTLDSLA